MYGVVRKTGFDEKIRDWIEEENHISCLGLQVLFNNSEEGELEGLGIFSGQVKRFPPKHLRFLIWDGIR